jgi:hypothetical protein
VDLHETALLPIRICFILDQAAFTPVRVGNEKPAQKNPPNKNQKNPPKKTTSKRLFLGFIGFF